MKILTLGCSFTYGTELPDIPAGAMLTRPENASKLAWGNILANFHNAEINNLSASGGSNGRVFRYAITETIQNSYDIVFCQWTEVTRVDLQYNSEDFPIALAPNWEWKNSAHESLKHFYVNYINTDHSYQTWLCQLIALQNHFKLINQKYIFLSMNSPIITALYTKYKNLHNQVDGKYFVGWDENKGMIDWTKKYPLGPSGHPLEQGHRRIAEIVNEYIRNLGWLP